MSRKEKKNQISTIWVILNAEWELSFSRKLSCYFERNYKNFT